MDLSNSVRAAEDRTRSKGVVAKSSVVFNVLSSLWDNLD